MDKQEELHEKIRVLADELIKEYPDLQILISSRFQDRDFGYSNANCPACFIESIVAHSLLNNVSHEDGSPIFSTPSDKSVEHQTKH